MKPDATAAMIRKMDDQILAAFKEIKMVEHIDWTLADWDQFVFDAYCTDLQRFHDYRNMLLSR